MKVFMAGATGAIGRSLVPQLVEAWRPHSPTAGNDAFPEVSSSLG